MYEILKTRAREWLSAVGMTADQLLWIVVIVGGALALVQLLAMYTTRWGESRTAFKSLFLALIIQGPLFAGAIFFLKSLGTDRHTGETNTPGQEFALKNIEFESNSPELPANPWERMAKAAPTRLDRTKPRDPKLEAIKNLDRIRRNEQPEKYKIPTDDKLAVVDDKVIDPKVQETVDPKSRTGAEPDAGPKLDEIESPASPVKKPKPSIREKKKTNIGEPTDIGKQSSLDSAKPPKALVDPDKVFRKGQTNNAEPTLDDPLEIDPAPRATANNRDPLPVEPLQPIDPGIAGGSPAKKERRTFRSGRKRPNVEREFTVDDSRKSGSPFRPSKRDAIADARDDRPIADIDAPRIPLENRNRVADAYKHRDAESRLKRALENGGSKASEKAVELALKWLADNQTRAGYWDCSTHGGGRGTKATDLHKIDRKRAGLNSDTGVTALALLAFLASGNTHEKGEYKKTVRKALVWLVKQQTTAGKETGFLGGNATMFARMYCHAMATYALAEAYGMSDPTQDQTWLRVAVERAVKFSVDTQNKTGGWRYAPGQLGDMSMFGWQLMALRSAEMNGITVPKLTNRRMQTFLADRSLGRFDGLAAYYPSTPGESHWPPTSAMTAEALFCKQQFGQPSTSRASREATAFLLNRLPKRTDWNLYYWYYGTLAMWHHGGREFEQWNKSLRDLLVKTQRQDGKLAGSWNPIGPWGRYGGRVYSTALAAMCLETYYRFLPLHKKR